eukprot:TRINITY_DN22236_c0_g1_i1.p1 TRINITY_DN22236_c0_g1~~TRINITY_DN22236_c0_g1_i1.p1  ORF type:complete len:752 (-),score=122.59 TRINITY_DN22236_c0_g1_i1:15-2270(-)
MTASKCRKPSSAKLLFGDEKHKRVDLVVQWYCEDITWLLDVSTEFLPDVSLFIIDKGHEKCDSRALFDSLRARLKFKPTLLRLPNVGRDGHSTVAFIHRYYDSLAEHTFFVQGGFHWIARGGLPKAGAKHEVARGWPDQPTALNVLLKKVLAQNPEFLPLTSYTSAGPVLAVDMEVEEAQAAPILDDNVLHFGKTSVDLYNRGRELYSIIFGGSACDAPPPVFTAGMQYSIRRDKLLSRSCDDWTALEDMLASCVEFIWVMERVTSPIFMSDKPFAKPSDWRLPGYCRGDQVAGHPTPKYWKDEWGCEPLSPHAAEIYRKIAPKRILFLEHFKGTVGDQLFQLAALLGIGRQANKTTGLLGRIQLALPDETVTPDNHPTVFPTIAGGFPASLKDRPALSSKFFTECTFEELSLGQRHAWVFGKTQVKSLSGQNWASEFARAMESTQKFIPLVPQNEEGCEVLKLAGRFRDTRYFNSVLDELPSVFWHQEFARKAEKQLEQLLPKSEWKNAVSVHYHVHNLPDARGYFSRAVEMVGKNLGSPKVVCVVFAEGSVEDLQGCEKQVRILDTKVGETTAFYMMSLLPSVVVATSSSSFWAAVVGQKKYVVAPDLTDVSFAYLKQPGWHMLDPTKLPEELLQTGQPASSPAMEEKVPQADRPASSSLRLAQAPNGEVDGQTAVTTAPLQSIDLPKLQASANSNAEASVTALRSIQLDGLQLENFTWISVAGMLAMVLLLVCRRRGCFRKKEMDAMA